MNPTMQTPPEVASFPLKDTSIKDVTDQEIVDIVAKLKHSEQDGLHLYTTTGAQIMRLSSDVIVKYGRKVGQHGGHEVRMIRLVREHTSILIPEVHRLFHRADVGYMVMQYVPSVTVADCWASLSAQRKQKLLDTMSAYVKELQGLSRADNHALGPLGWCEELRGLFFTNYGAGPFGSIDEMEEWFNQKLRVSIRMNKAPADSGTFSNAMRPLCIVHLDIIGKNILLDGEDRVWLLDWEYAGVYPHYFEAASLSARSRFPFEKALYEHLRVGEQVARKIDLLESTAWVRMVAPFANK